MRSNIARVASLSVAVAALTAGPAGAQPSSLPPLPPPTTPTPPSSEPPPAEPTSEPPAPTEAPPPAPAPSPPPAPPPVVYVEPEPAPVKAPKYSLWLGGRLGFLTYGGAFYQNEQFRSETTGNFVTPGAALEFDVGARLGRRYIPYFGFELGIVGAGHRFDGAPDTDAHTQFYGLGFRYVGGDVDSAGFLTDVSIGVRRVRVSNVGGTYTLSAIEILRLGLGAEIRLTRKLTLSPLVTFSGGVMRDTDGDVLFGPSGDGIGRPNFRNGAVIDSAYSETYLVFTIGMGVHFDLLAK